MLTSYLKLTLRNLWKNKTYSFLNIFGLATGIACAALIFLWVEDELTFNHQFKKRDTLYRIMENQKADGRIVTSGSTPGPLAAAIKEEILGIKNTARLSWELGQLFVLGEKSINEAGMYADPAILSMLDLPFIYGASGTALQQLRSVVISESMSKRFFGNNNPVGKTLKANSQQVFNADGAYLVTGVFKDLPQNATYKFQWLSPYELFETKNPDFKTWEANATETLVELAPSVNAASVNEKLRDYLKTKVEGSQIQCFLFSMNDWRLYNHFTDGKQDGGNIKYVRLFSLIAVIILLIACINFMNLATARSQQRAKEVGVRKVMGAGKRGLVQQFIGEALFMSLLAVLVAICMLYLMLPAYNLLVQKNLSLNLFHPLHLSSLLIIGLFAGLIAGSYPAFYLSAFNPVTVLKGMWVKTGSGSIFIRKGLVVVQFTVSIVLIICTMIIYQQVQYVKQRDLGFEKDNLIWMLLQGKLKDHFHAARTDLLNTGLVANAAMCMQEPLFVYVASDKFTWQGKDPGTRVLIRSNSVSPEYISTMGIKLLSGRDFYSIPGVDSGNVIINESMAKLMGAAGKPGGVITRDSVNFTIIGVIKDFVYNDMFSAAQPLVLRSNLKMAGVMVISFKSGVDLKEALTKTETIIKANNPGFPFEYLFVDDEFNKLFATETLIEKLAGIFALLTIFISCLGLFGLAAYTAARRTKEMGIRKVLGASVPGLARLVSQDFLQLVIISCVLAFPLAWWAMNHWLQNYQYRTPVQWWVFGLAGISVLLIALLTVSYQAVKAARVNPVKSLRIEY